MKKYKLTEEEKAVVEKFCNFGIPYIFCSGEYGMCVQYFEILDYEAERSLLKGKKVDENIYKIIISEKNIEIEKEKLCGYSLEYYNLSLQIEDILKKYYHLLES